MNSTLIPVELVGGPLCGAETYLDADDTNEFFEVPYSFGVAIYQMQENGKGRYVRG